MNFSKGLLLGAAAMCFVSLTTLQAHAGILAKYTFEESPNGTLNPASALVGIEADPATLGNGDLSVGGVLGGGFGVFQRTSTTSETLASAISSNDYLSIVIDQAAGADPFSVSSISYRYFMSDSNTAAAYNSYLFTSQTNTTPGTFADGDQIGGGAIVGTGSSTPTTNKVTIDTSGIAELQNLTNALELRIYLTDDQNVSGHVQVIDDVTINGVPEPGSLALLGLGGLCVLWRRRPA